MQPSEADRARAESLYENDEFYFQAEYTKAKFVIEAAKAFAAHRIAAEQSRTAEIVAKLRDFGNRTRKYALDNGGMHKKAQAWDAAADFIESEFKETK